MVFRYNNENEYKKIFEGHCLDKCSKCSEFLEISMEHIKVEVSNKFIDIEEIPMLKCEKCGTVYYTEYAKGILYGLYHKLCRLLFIEV